MANYAPRAPGCRPDELSHVSEQLIVPRTSSAQPHARVESSPSVHHLLVIGALPDTISEVNHLVGTTRSHFCESYRDASAALLHAAPHALILELHPTRVVDGGVAPIVAALAGQLPTLVRARLRPASARYIVDLAAVAANLHVCLRPHDDFGAAVLRIMSRQENESPVRALVRVLERHLDPTVRAIGVAATVAGAKNTSVAQLSSICQMPVRSMERRLRSTGSPSAGTLLAWMSCLHATWRCDVLGYSAKRAALEAGFSPAGLSNLMARRAGVRPARARELGFWHILDRFESYLAHANRLSRHKTL